METSEGMGVCPSGVSKYTQTTHKMIILNEEFVEGHRLLVENQPEGWQQRSPPTLRQQQPLRRSPWQCWNDRAAARLTYFSKLHVFVASTSAPAVGRALVTKRVERTLALTHGGFDILWEHDGSEGA